MIKYFKHVFLFIYLLQVIRNWVIIVLRLLSRDKSFSWKNIYLMHYIKNVNNLSKLKRNDFPYSFNTFNFNQIPKYRFFNKKISIVENCLHEESFSITQKVKLCNAVIDQICCQTQMYSTRYSKKPCMALFQQNPHLYCLLGQLQCFNCSLTQC